MKLLPTPMANEGEKACFSPRDDGHQKYLTNVIAGGRFGHYAPAVQRWERVLGRAAPDPTQPSKTGKPQLSPAFVEFLMGLPAGWVTDAGLSRAQQLRALGNGVVPQQAAEAIGFMVNRAHTLEAA